MKLTNEQYDRAKYFLLMVVPAIITAIQLFGELYQFNATLVTGTISILAGLAGICIKYLAGKYEKKGDYE